MPLQIRRGTNAERVAMTQPLAAGELLWITDDQRLYVGNGSTLPSSLVSITGYTNENAQDAAATLFTTGTHRSISFAYNDSLNRIDATVDLSAYNGPIDGDLIGSVFADNSTRLIDGTSGKINLNGTIGGHVIPDQNSVYDLGSNANKFRDLYLSGSTIFLGSASITSIGSVVNLPAGSTVNGVLIGSGSGAGVIEGSTYKINIAADDSSIMLNSDLETVTASGGFFGNVTGNVTGNINGVVTATTGSSLVGNVTGNINGVVTGTAGSSLIGNVTGNLTGAVTGTVTGDLKGSVFADDSSILVDSTNGVLRGSLIGDVTGSVFSDDNSVMLVDATNGTLNGIYITEIDTPRLTINRDDDTGISIIMNSLTSAGDSSSGAEFRVSRGSLASPTAPSAGDPVFLLTGKAYKADIADYALSSAITSVVGSESLVGMSNYVSGRLEFYATNGTRDLFDTDFAMTFDGAGLLSAPTVEARTAFQLPVYADDTARSTAIPTPAAGMMIFMQAGTAPAATNTTQVYSGSAWVNL